MLLLNLFLRKEVFIHADGLTVYGRLVHVGMEDRANHIQVKLILEGEHGNMIIIRYLDMSRARYRRTLGKKQTLEEVTLPVLSIIH